MTLTTLSEVGCAGVSEEHQAGWWWWTHLSGSPGLAQQKALVLGDMPPSFNMTNHPGGRPAAPKPGPLAQGLPGLLPEAPPCGDLWAWSMHTLEHGDPGEVIHSGLQCPLLYR